MLIFPPCGMASRAFTTRLIRICWTCAGSAFTFPKSGCNTGMTSMLAGMRRRRSLCVSQTEAFRSSTVGSINCLRLNASNCRVNDAAFWLAPLISAKWSRSSSFSISPCAIRSL